MSHASIGGVFADVADQAGFADPRLTAERGQPVPGHRRLEPSFLEQLHLGLTPYQRGEAGVANRF